MSQPHRTPVQAPRRYLGGCACRKVRFTVDLTLHARDPHTGSVWELSAPASRFGLLAGQEQVAGHQFGAEDAHHFFCLACNTRVFSIWSPEGEARASIDVKSLSGPALQLLPAANGLVLGR